MLQNSIVVKHRHQKFIDEISESGIVWALENNEGFATSSSNEFEDKKGNPIGLICFWSDKKLANICAKKNWTEYIPKKLQLAAFIENWCVGLYNDNLMIGTNFDWNMFGFEIEPLELVTEIIEALKTRDKNLQFVKFEGLEDLESQIKEIANEN